ncbi:MAG: energy-coupling factor ABC transporter ATP-binding protein [Desulfurococcaceae archaeon]
MELKLIDVWHSYNGVNYVLRGVNIAFSKPGVYVVIGPNGSGKTTLLKIIALMIKPTKGTVLVDGVDYWSLRDEGLKNNLKKNVVYVHDKPLVFRGSVEYNISLGIKSRNPWEWSKIVEYYMSRYNILNIRSESVFKISTGQAKIVTILRALLLGPRILLLDEPFTFLDKDRTRVLLENIVELSKEKVIIIATHYMYRELDEIKNQVIELPLLTQ